ncbi:MAG: acyltransferase [Clostridia bacterium]|nr:acyltransferase [Clostridia bacterium]
MQKNEQGAYLKAGGEYSVVLDCLRVVAMLGVLAVHSTSNFPFPEWLDSIFVFGRRGVQAFFALSAFLGCSYFMRPNAGVASYYKRRALRILPTYYAAIVAAMVYVECFTGGFTADIFHLGWVRYFLGLNTILPSNSFTEWNNCFAFWSITDFIAFYALAPLIFKFVRTYKSAVVFFIICFALAYLCKAVSKQVPADCFSDIHVLIKWTPLGQMQHFALGIWAFFAIRENKIKPTVIAMLVIAAVSTRSEMIGAALACLAILLVKNHMISLGKAGLGMLKFASKYSFHVYLTHMLGLTIAGVLATRWLGEASCAFYWAKAGITVAVIVLLCGFLELVQRLADAVFQRKSR